MERPLSTKEVADFLGVNEKMIYTLVSEKGLPASKVTGKWLFPKQLVERWLENNTVNHPGPATGAGERPGVFIAAGSNDILFERALALFMDLYPDILAVFGNVGSLGGLKALRTNSAHLATSHLVQDDDEFNFSFAAKELEVLPAVVNFCRREQGILTAKGNPHQITSVEDMVDKKLRIANRPKTTGTRLLFDRELERLGADPAGIPGYENEFRKHLDVGLEIQAGRAQAGPAVGAVAGLLDLDFVPIHWERFDLLVPKDKFFNKSVQLFLNMLHAPRFHTLADELTGYDLSLAGRMVFPP